MRKFPCTILRSGTSKGVFFNEEVMPKDREKWEEFLLDVMGSPDKKQIDGLGGANSLTSKVAIIKKSEREGFDVDYTFAQVSLTDSKIDMKGNCGNISSGVGPYAVENGLVEAVEPVTTVRIYNTNTGKRIVSEVKVSDGMYDPNGDTYIPGVPNPGSVVYLSFYGPEGSVTGKLLPTGNKIDLVETSVGKIEISIVDAANPLVFIKAEDMGLKGTELHYEFSQEKLDLLEEVRSIAAELCGFAKKENATKESPAVPKTTVISAPQDYKNEPGQLFKAEDMDLVIRMMSMQKPHQALAITGAVCASLAAATEGTLVSKIAKPDENGKLKLGHPGGVMNAFSGKGDNDEVYVKVERTARRIMDGFVYPRKDYEV
jgi:2-methylaconitate cis-trans-isomerase PrpF